MLKAPSLQSILKTQARNASIGADQIEAVAAHLAQLMHNFHGDIEGNGWTAHICHDAGAEFVLIRPKLGAKDKTITTREDA